jgi:hypothetical protein
MGIVRHSADPWWPFLLAFPFGGIAWPANLRLGPPDGVVGAAFGDDKACVVHTPRDGRAFPSNVDLSA